VLGFGFGAFRGRTVLADASTPLSRTGGKRGYGTAAASRDKSESGSISIATVPSENARRSIMHASPSLPGMRRSCATAGRKMSPVGDFPAVSQYAALAALEGPQDEIGKMRDAFHERRDLMVNGLSALPGIQCALPDGAFYVFADCKCLYGIEHKLGPSAGKRIANDEDVAFWLLEEAFVATVPGGPFGAPGYVRSSFATSPARITEGLARMAAAIAAARI
jgi:hypothetical protein